MKRSLTVATLLLCSALVLRLYGAGEPRPSPTLAQASFQLPAGPQTPAPSPAQTPTPLPSGYAGSDTCVLCHADQEASLKSTKHGQTANPRSPAAKLGCESCHGPGQAHVDDDAKG
jgi:hypothetical protein